MNKQIFINVCVHDVARSKALYTAMGFTNNPEFSDSDQQCMMWSEHIYVMLQSKKMFQTHTRKSSSDSTQHPQAIYTIPMESLTHVHDIVKRGLQAGGLEPIPMVDEGHMQIRTLEDFDGHWWSFIYLDMIAFRSRATV